MRLLIPGRNPAGPREDDFRKLSVAFSNFISATLFSEGSTNPFWPLDRNADNILRAFWDRVIQTHPIPGIAAYQADQLSVEVMRHEDHLIAAMRFPRLHGCVCISAGLWWVGPLEDPSRESVAKGSRRFFVMGEDVGAPGEAAIYDASSEQIQSLGMIPSADLELFVDTMLERYIEGNTSVSFPTGDASMAEAMDQARALVPYFMDILENYPTVEAYSVKVRIEDENGVEYFWLENTKWQNGSFLGTIGNDPERTKCVTYGQAVTVTPDQICDWYYMWEGKMRGNYTLRASLPFMDPVQAAKFSSVLDDA